MMDHKLINLKEVISEDIPFDAWIKGIEKIEEKRFTDNWDEECLKKESGLPTSYIFLSVSQEKVLAYSIMSVAADEGELLRIAVDPELEGRGLGGELLDHSIKELEKQGVCEIFLEVREHNENAIKMYYSHGFEKVGVRKKYYKDPCEDALVLKR